MYYHQFNFNDFIGEIRFLKNQEIAIYIKLQMQYLQEEKPLKNNIKFLSRLCEATEEDTLNILNLFYELKDENWHRDKLDKLISEYKSNIDANRRGGIKSGKSRKAKALELKSTSTTLEVTNNHELETSKSEIHKPRNIYRVKKPQEVDQYLWSSFLNLREERNTPLTSGILNTLIIEAKRQGITLDDALSICLKNNWVYLKAEWFQSKDNSTPFDDEYREE